MTESKDDEKAHEPDRKNGDARLHLLWPQSRSLTVTEDHIQSLLQVRRGREDLFGRNLFSDPAWDVLLEAYAADLGDRHLSVSDLAHATGLPWSVLDRWLKALLEADLISVTPGGQALQRLVRLTPDARAKMSSLAKHWGSAFVSI